ncbi:putative uncharacterized transposon-derived protein F52C9.6, partial [Varanus komodoensis]
MRKAGLDESPVGIKIAGRNINSLRYADDTILMAESEDELKSPLMWVKEESAKVGLKLNIKKTKIMAFGPMTSWQIDGEEIEVVTDFIFLGSKITTDGDCSQEIKRCLLLGRKAMANLDSILKSRDHPADKSVLQKHSGEMKMAGTVSPALPQGPGRNVDLRARSNVLVSQAKFCLGLSGLENMEDCLPHHLGGAKQKTITKLGPVTFFEPIHEFQEDFAPSQSVPKRIQRLCFRQRAQLPGEPFLSFASALWELASGCGFGPLQEELVLDQLIEKAEDARIREALFLQADSLTLARAVELGSQMEAAFRGASSRISAVIDQREQQIIGNRSWRKKGSRYYGCLQRRTEAVKPLHGIQCHPGGKKNHGFQRFHSMKLCGRSSGVMQPGSSILNQLKYPDRLQGEPHVKRVTEVKAGSHQRVCHRRQAVVLQ